MNTVELTKEANGELLRLISIHPRLQDVWNAIKWLLERAPDKEDFYQVPPTKYYLVKSPKPEVASIPQLLVVFDFIGDKNISIIGIQTPDFD